MKLLVLGYSGVGKSVAAELLAEMLDTKYANTSDAIISSYADEYGLEFDYVMANKSTLREKLFNHGRLKQSVDPLWPQSVQLKDHDILTGLRNPNEIIVARQNNLYDLIIWISREGFQRGSTDKLSESDADVVVSNDGTIEDLKVKLQELIQQHTKPTVS